MKHAVIKEWNCHQFQHSASTTCTRNTALVLSAGQDSDCSSCLAPEPGSTSHCLEDCFIVVFVCRTASVFHSVLPAEDEENFSWLFDCYHDAVRGKVPVTCFSDRDPAALAAMKLSWRGTAQFSCIWHLEKNIREKLKAALGELWQVTRFEQQPSSAHGPMPNPLVP